MADKAYLHVLQPVFTLGAGLRGLCTNVKEEPAKNMSVELQNPFTMRLC